MDYPTMSILTVASRAIRSSTPQRGPVKLARILTARFGIVLLLLIVILTCGIPRQDIHVKLSQEFNQDSLPCAPTDDAVRLPGDRPDRVRGAHDVEALARFWGDMTDLFYTHPPSPRRLLLPSLRRPSHLDGYTIQKADELLMMTDQQALETRKSHLSVTTKLPDYSAMSNQFISRGIVILAGGRYTQIATTSIYIIRLYHRSTLPIEVWVPRHSDLNSEWEEEMGQLGVDIRVLSDYATIGSSGDWMNPIAWMTKPRPRNPWQWKAMIMLFSTFEELLFLDADSVPARDPILLFETEAYTSTGSVVWPDYWSNLASSYLPYITGITETPSDTLWHRRTPESGQMLWNKKLHWKVSLELVLPGRETKVTQLLESAPGLLLQLLWTVLLVHGLDRLRTWLGG